MQLHNCRRLALASLFVVSQAPTTWAAQGSEEEELALAYGDKSTVSIATGSKQSLRRAPAAATVITAEDIIVMGAVDLDDVLRTVPGVHINRNAGNFAPLYTIRGIGGGGPTNPQVLMLLNGIPVTTVYNGDKGGFWSGYPLEHVARVEVIRGPGSALYGADAYAGVINVITKTVSDTPGTQVGARAGTFNTWDTWMNHGGKIGELEVAGYLRAGATDGFSEVIKKDNASAAATTAPGPVNTGRDAIDANLDLGYHKWRWRSGIKYRDHTGTYAGVSSALDPESYGKSERINTDLSWTDPQFAPDWGLGFMVSYLYYAEETPNGVKLFPPGQTFPSGTFPNGVIGGPNRWERQYRLSLFATYTGFADHRLRIGIGHDDLDLYRTSTYKNYLVLQSGALSPTGPVQDYNDIQPHIRPQRREVDYAYAQDEWRISNDWSLTAGVRFDHYSDFGNTTNPRLALVWDVDYDLTAKLLYGEAFRAPSFNEQYGINPVANGNTSLRPELIKTVETAFSWQASRDAQINLSFFYHEMKDIIRAVSNPVAGTGSTFNNVGDQTGRGMELEANFDLRRDLRLSGNYAYQRSEDVPSNQDPGYAPHQRIYARADWRFFNGWLLSSQVNWVADRKRDRRDVNNDGVQDDLRNDIDDYATVDLTVQTHAKRERWHAMFSIRNLFDADAFEPSLAPGVIPNDLPLPGRSYLLQTSYQF